jgi:hypothetical protein
MFAIGRPMCSIRKIQTERVSQPILVRQPAPASALPSRMVRNNHRSQASNRGQQITIAVQAKKDGKTRRPQKISQNFLV